MSIDIGSTVEGVVMKLADYGAIVRLQGGRTGLIHISEIADTFVRDVSDYFKEQDRVRVKVLSINGKGRYELSTKQAEELQPELFPVSPKPKSLPRPPDPVYLGPEDSIFPAATPLAAAFEDRMSQYMKDSQQRLLDIKRSLDFKNGVKRR